MSGTTPRTRQRPAAEATSSAATPNPAAETPTDQLAPRQRNVFQRNGTGLSARPDPRQALQARGANPAISALRDRMTQPARPGDTPIAVIDAYGHIMPFDQESPVDRLVLANVPDITYIYTYADLRRAQEINERAIRERRFAETVQGAKMFVEPVPVKHGFRSGQEVVTAMYDETRMGEGADAIAVHDLDAMTRGTY